MPELPEVETVRRGLEPVLTNRVLAHVDQRRPDLRRPFPERFAERLTGRRVTGLTRRSKYLLIGLDGGETWIIHLGMSGRILVESYGPHPSPLWGEGTASHGEAGKHDHVIVTTDRGAVVTYNDVRRFGLMDLWPTADLDRHPLLAGLGPEPLGNAFNGAVLAAARVAALVGTLEEHTLIGGLGSAVTDLFADNLDNGGPKVLRLGIPDAFPAEYGSQDSMLETFGLQPPAIADAIRDRLGGSGKETS